MLERLIAMPRISDVPKLVSGAAQEFWVDIQNSKQPPLPCITLIHESPKPRVVMVMQAATLEEAIRLSHDSARKMSQTAAVCIEVWDGYVKTGSERSDAILINVWVEGHGPFFFSQRYRRNPFELIDEAGRRAETTGPEG